MAFLSVTYCIIATTFIVVTCRRDVKPLSSDSAEEDLCRPDLVPGRAHARPDRRALDASHPARSAAEGAAALPGSAELARRRGAQHAFCAPQGAGEAGTGRAAPIQ